MERELMGMVVRQNHKTCMLCANDLHSVGNSARNISGFSKKQMASYFNLESTRELINEICLIDNLKSEEVKKSERGKSGGTWVHPVLFVDMAMWYSPELKVRIIKWVVDGLLDARDESGNEFKAMMTELTKCFPDEMSDPSKYIAVSRSIAAACRVGLGKDKWQQATEDQLKLRKKIQESAVLLADMSPNVGTCINKAIEKSLNKLQIEE